MFTGFVILSYYTVVAGWTLSYFVRCSSWTIGGYETHDASADFGSLITDGSLQTLLSGLFMVFTVGIVLGGIGRGIERVARLLMPALFVILILLLGSALTMDGAGRALEFIFMPRFDELGRDGVLEALGHAFFTLSLGMGAMITYGSYLSRHESVVSSAGLVVVLDTVIALFATVIMFSVIFSTPGMSDSVDGSTAGMLFMTLPDLFYTQVPFGQILAPLFYLLVGFAALTSTISLLEVVVAYFIDERRWTRRNATMACGTVIFGISILCGLSFGASSGLSGFTVFEGKQGLFATLDHLASNWLLPIGGFLTTLAAGWFLARKVSARELSDPAAPGWFHYGMWRFFIRFVSPAAVLAIILAVIFLHADFS